MHTFYIYIYIYTHAQGPPLMAHDCMTCVLSLHALDNSWYPNGGGTNWEATGAGHPAPVGPGEPGSKEGREDLYKHNGEITI